MRGEYGLLAGGNAPDRGGDVSCHVVRHVVFRVHSLWPTDAVEIRPRSETYPRRG